MSISIFAKPTSKARDGHLQRVSSLIRGAQIAKAIGARLNPTENFEDDVCIYVKPHVKAGDDFLFQKKSCLDIIDGWMLLPLARNHPEVTIITCSYVDFHYVTSQVDNKVILIPQHHCNFERIKHETDKIQTVGCIGTSGAFPFIPDEIREGLKKRNITFLEFSQFYTREDIVEFYKTIDVQLVWRPYIRSKKIRMTNPLKIVNASSFGVPTIALTEPAFSEVRDCYLPVTNPQEFFNEFDKLMATPELYRKLSETCLKKSEDYHINTVAALYRALS